MPERAYYELLERIGEGGMGRVYRAVHRPSGHHVAVKVLRARLRDSASQRVVLQEATAAARLRHPNIVELLDLTRDAEGAPALVMELVDGGDLSRFVASWPGWSVVVDALCGALDGLAAAHAEGIVHRDLKPGNLLIDSAGTVKLVDFGVAEVLQPLRRDQSHRKVAGTPIYMAPEQFQTDGELGPWTDLYSFGIILHELLTGRPPYAGPLPGLVLEKSRGPLAKVVPRRGLRVDEEVVDLVRALTDPRPRARPRFAALLRAKLHELRDAVVEREMHRADPGRAATAPSVPPQRPSSRRTVPIPLTPDAFEVHDAAADGPPSSSPDSARAATELASASAHPSEPPPSTFPPLPASVLLSAGSALMRLRSIPLAGRRRERELLLRAMGAVTSERTTHMIGFVGPAGSGKSALARWGLGEAERTGTMETAAAGYDVSGEGIAGGLRHAVGALLAVPSGRDVADGWPACWDWVRDGDDPFDRQRVARWLGQDRERSAERVRGNGQSVPPQQVPELAHAVLRAVGRVRPLYLWLDDVAWSRDGALELLERLLASRDCAVLVVATFRSGTAAHESVRDRMAALFRHESATLHELPPLSASERLDLLGSLAPLRRSFAKRLSKRLDDTPLLLVQRVHSWIDHDLLEATHDGLRPARGQTFDSLIAERSTDALFGRRVDDLLARCGDDAGRAEIVLLRAALLGASFEERALRASVLDDPGLAAVVDDVVDLSLLTGLTQLDPTSGAHRFDHGLLHEHLLARWKEHADHRASARAVAAALSSVYGAVRAEIGERTAHLLRDAGEHLAAYRALAATVTNMARFGYTRRVDELLAVAHQWLDEERRADDDVLRAEVFRAGAAAEFYLLHYDEASRLLEKAERLYRMHGDDWGLTQSLHLKASLALYQDRFLEAERITRELLEQGTDDPGLMISMRHHLVNIADMRNDLHEARRLARENEVAAHEHGPDWRARFSKIAVADYDLLLGETDGAAECLERVAEESLALGDAHVADEALDSLMRADAMRDRWDAVRARLRVRIPWAVAAPDPWRETAFRILDALVAVEDGTEAEARAATARMLVAFDHATHDEAFSRLALGRIVADLHARGLTDLAATVRDRVAERARAIDRGFGRA